MDRPTRYKQRQPKFAVCGHCKNKFLMNAQQRWKEESGRASMFFCGRFCAGKYRSKHWGLKDMENPNLVAERSRKTTSHKAPVDINWPLVLRVPHANKMGVFLHTLGSGWKTNFEIATPTESEIFISNRVLDIANPSMRIAIDLVDTRKGRDTIKEDFLRSRGWTLLRFSRSEIEGNLHFCLKMVWTAISRLAAA